MSPEQKYFCLAWQTNFSFGTHGLNVLALRWIIPMLECLCIARAALFLFRNGFEVETYWTKTPNLNHIYEKIDIAFFTSPRVKRLSSHWPISNSSYAEKCYFVVDDNHPFGKCTCQAPELVKTKMGHCIEICSCSFVRIFHQSVITRWLKIITDFPRKWGSRSSAKVQYSESRHVQSIHIFVQIVWICDTKLDMSKYGSGIYRNLLPTCARWVNSHELGCDLWVRTWCTSILFLNLFLLIVPVVKLE